MIDDDRCCFKKSRLKGQFFGKHIYHSNVDQSRNFSEMPIHWHGAFFDASNFRAMVWQQLSVTRQIRNCLLHKTVSPNNFSQELQVLTYREWYNLKINVQQTDLSLAFLALEPLLLEMLYDEFCFHFICMQCVFNNLHVAYSPALSRNTSYKIFTHRTVVQCWVARVVIPPPLFQMYSYMICSVQFRYHGIQLIPSLQSKVSKPCVALQEILHITSHIGPTRRLQPKSMSMYPLETQATVRSFDH